MIELKKTYNFDFLFWNWTFDVFNTRVKLPNSTFGFFNYQDKRLCLYLGNYLLTILNK